DVALNDNQVLVDNGGAGCLPLITRIIEPTGVENAQVLLPLQLAVNVVAEESLGSKESNYILSVSRWSRGGVTRLDVALYLWNAFGRNLIPDDPSRALVEAVDVPGVLGYVSVRSHIAVQTVPEILVALAADGRGDEHPVSPHDGARVSQPWY